MPRSGPRATEGATDSEGKGKDFMKQAAVDQDRGSAAED